MKTFPEHHPTVPRLWSPILALLILGLSGCGFASVARQAPLSPTLVKTRLPLSPTPSPPTPALPSATPAPASPTLTETLLPSPAHTATGTATQTPTITPTPPWVWNPPGEVIAPILLYHHIREAASNDRYSVSPAVFETQMEKLKEWGYQPIGVSLFLAALMNGANLPPRPIVITFDDGHEDVYRNAFPIMQKLGFPGVIYLVGNRLDAEGFMSPEQIAEMTAAGWEVGSHSMTHSDLTIVHASAREELLNSRLELENELGLDVKTIAYPFGLIDPYIAQKTQEYGYWGGMGLGIGWTHTPNTLYYLERIEIRGSYDLETFGNLLPWGGASEPGESVTPSGP